MAANSGQGVKYHFKHASKMIVFDTVFQRVEKRAKMGEK
jgi:hypothetical protein